MGALAAARHVEAQGSTPVARLRARNAVSAYVRTHSGESQDSDYYPKAEMRALTVHLAWQYAINPQFLRHLSADGVSGRLAPSTPEALARQLCMTVANVTDGSIGNLVVSSSRDASGGPSTTGGPVNVIISNYGSRPVEVT